jgi:hypothetical protein
VDKMSKSTDTIDEAHESMGRRDFLTKAAAAGAIAWATPVILSHAAHAAPPGGTPKCRPTISTPTCQLLLNCPAAGNLDVRDFPGFNVPISACPCSGTPTTCIRIRNLSSCGGTTLFAYRGMSDCNDGSASDFLPLNSWQCLPGGSPAVWFGPERLSNGRVPVLTNSCTITFDLDVWSSCPDRTPADGPAFVCRTFSVASIGWSGGASGTITNCDFPDGGSAICSTLADPPPAPCTCP